MVLFEIIAATLAVSLISLVGIILIGLNEKKFSSIVHMLVSLAAGVMLGDVFIHIIPEAVKPLGIESALLFVLGGFILFFAIEKIMTWHHCKNEEHEVQKGKIVSSMVLIGDGVHNFLDGAIIAASFMTSFPIGIITTIAIILHEVPHELGDFAVLVHLGMKKGKAFFYNFLSALTAIAGGIITFFFLSEIQSATPLILPIAGGALLYIAATDLVPELHKEKRLGMNVLQLFILLTGIAMMYAIKKFGG